MRPSDESPTARAESTMIACARFDASGDFQHNQRTNKRRKLNASAQLPPCAGKVQNDDKLGQGNERDSSPAASESAPEEDALEHHLSHAVPPHPLGIKPLGNAWDANVNIKALCGSFASLPDELLVQLLELLEARDLQRLGATCKALYAFCRSDDLWKTLFIESSSSSSQPSKPSRDFTWRGTWRSTLLNIPAHAVSAIPCPNLYSDLLYRPHHCAHLPLAPFASNIPAANAIARLPDLTAEEYARNWADKPFILTEPVKAWPAYKEWSIDHLLHQHSETVFRAEAVDWKLSAYVAYMRDNAGESPLYLFDSHFAAKMRLDENEANTSPYTPPATFAPDLFTALAPHRPSHRWLIIGPARAGSTFHADPNGTSAWNAVLRGSKYWLMFPPPDASDASDSDSSPGSALDTAIPGVHLSPDMSHITSPLSLAEYLLTFHAEARGRSTRPSGRAEQHKQKQKQRQRQRVVEAVCEQGELLHVPAGWFHMVVNLDEGVAITHNFVSEPGLEHALAFLRDRREQVSGFEWGGTASTSAASAGRVDGDGDRDGDGDGWEGQEFELLVSRLRTERPEVLERALKALERRDEAEAEKARARARVRGRARVGGREGGRVGGKAARGTKWEQVTQDAGLNGSGGDGTAEGFSFGFGFDDEDEDEDEDEDADGAVKGDCGVK